MPLPWTPEQVLSLAPNEGARKNAGILAQPHKWQMRAQDVEAKQLWGVCHGSGAEMYRVHVDLHGPDFNCSCPSRKRPCKHALGLFLLFANQPGAFEVAEPPGWVSAWLAKPKNARESEPAAPDISARAAGQARRLAERDKKIRAGLDELETWLCDLLRQGLAGAQSQPRSVWETAAGRLVDAQAPGLARLVRAMADLSVSGDGWQERLLGQIARLSLAIEGYRRFDQLSTPQQADLKALIGFTIKQDELLKDTQTNSLSDTWLVLGREVEEETKLLVQRVWLWGRTSRRPALVLSYAPPGGILDAGLVPGTAVHGDLVFYPGMHPLRAVFRSRGSTRALPAGLPGCASLCEATATYATALAQNPWIERYPVAFSGVTPTYQDGEWLLYDQDQRRVLLSKTFAHGWTLLALSGGAPIGVFGEWNGERLMPLSTWADGQFHAFRPRLEGNQ